MSFTKTSPKNLLILSVTAGLLAGCTLPAYAEETTNPTPTSPTSEWLATETLNNLDVKVEDPALLEDLSKTVTDAENLGIIDKEIADTANTAITNPETVTEDQTRPLFTNHLEKQKVNWEQVQADWTAAFETVRADFEACKTAGTAAEECGKGLGLKLQIAHADILLSVYDARLQAIANLPAERQAEALAHLEEHRARTVQRLTEAQARLDAGDYGPSNTPRVPTEEERTLLKDLTAQLGLPERARPELPAANGDPQVDPSKVRPNNTPQNRTQQQGAVSPNSQRQSGAGQQPVAPQNNAGIPVTSDVPATSTTTPQQQQQQQRPPVRTQSNRGQNNQQPVQPAPPTENEPVEAGN